MFTMVTATIIIMATAITDAPVISTNAIAFVITFVKLFKFP